MGLFVTLIINETQHDTHRDRTRAHMLCCFGVFPHLNMQKNCWLWAPTTPKTVSLLFDKTKSGPINNQHNNFKWGNIFAGICTLVLSLWWHHSTIILSVVFDLLLCWLSLCWGVVMLNVVAPASLLKKDIFSVWLNGKLIKCFGTDRNHRSRRWLRKCLRRVWNRFFLQILSFYQNLWRKSRNF